MEVDGVGGGGGVGILYKKPNIFYDMFTVQQIIEQSDSFIGIYSIHIVLISWHVLYDFISLQP